MSQNNCKTKCIKFLQVIDVFSYIPVPQAYPISTKKSKIGSTIFICAIIGYLIYDFYKFVTDNVPNVNAYETDIINKGFSPVPRLGFGMYFKQTTPTGSTYFMFNDSSYFTYKFETYLTKLYPNKTDETTYVQIPLMACDNDKINNWTSGWYSNLTCVDVNPATISQLNVSYPVVDEEGQLLVADYVIDQIAYSYYMRLLIYVCVNTTSSMNCAPATQINNVLKNSTLYVLGSQPSRYDFKAGKPLGLNGNTAVTYKYTVKANQTTTSSLYVYPTQFQMFPNLLTQFTMKKKQYSRYARDYTTTASVASPYMYRVRIWPEWAMNIVENHPQTLIQKLSEWSAFIGLILFVGGICFLGYNKNKFSKKNPDWEKFDQVLKQQRADIEMQNMSLTKRDLKDSTDLMQKEDEIHQKYNNNKNDPNIFGKQAKQHFIEDSVDLDDSNNIMKIRQKIMAEKKK